MEDQKLDLNTDTEDTMSIEEDVIDVNDETTIDVTDEVAEVEEPTKSKPEPSTTDIAIQNVSFGELSPTDYFNISDRDLTILTRLAFNANIGISTLEDAILVMMRCKDLGLSFASSIHHMFVISSKIGIDVHLIKTILLRPGSGVTWKKLRDYEPDYMYTDGMIIYKGLSELPKEAVILPKLKGYEDVSKKYVSEGKLPVAKLPTPIDPKDPSKGLTYKPIDFVTEYEFHRTYTEFGETKERTTRSIFSKARAIRAGLVKPNGGHTKYPEILCDHRAFTFGARDIADDLIMGAREITELLESANMDFDYNDNQEVVIRDRDGNVVK